MNPESHYSSSFARASVWIRSESDSASSFSITALVRDAERAKLLETKFGVKAAIGSLKDLEMLTELAEGAHLVFHTVSW